MQRNADTGNIVKAVLSLAYGGYGEQPESAVTIKTNLRGRIKNTQLSLNRGLMPLFEAVQNSIHAIEEGSSDGRIVVEIVRGQATLNFGNTTSKSGPDSLADISGFKIKDNGVGFTDEHMKSFETLDSDLKAKIGGRGVGRLLWLKAFDGASVDSVYQDGGSKRCRRNFIFTAANGVSDHLTKDVPQDSATGTIVDLYGFYPKYRDASRKTAEAIANSLFEHCLWYFVREGGVPTIFVRDGEESINLDEVCDQRMHDSATADSIALKGNAFELTHIKLRSTISKPHFIGWCASNRLVNEESITGKIPGLYGRLGNDDDPFFYACYVTSPYLNERVRSERTGFSIETQDSKGLLGETEVALDELKKVVLGKAEEYLSSDLEATRKAGIARVHDFVARKQPGYRPILDRISERDLYVDPTISDRDLDVFLHKHKSDAEAQLLSEGHSILKPDKDENIKDYGSRVRKYLTLANDLKKADLAEYVSHRKVILDLLRLAIERQEDGKYSREEILHELIMPMRKTSNSIEFEHNNLWLVDERLTFHDFLASDKSLKSMPITNSGDRQEPDILALNVFDEPILIAEGADLPLASIVIVEIKRPMRNDATTGERDPIDQTLDYLDRVRNGKVQTNSGRPIPNALDIPGFCYIVCDITPTIEQRCKKSGLTVSSDHMGYFGYNQNYKAYIEVISFDRMLKGATERNRAFFSKLGLPAN